MRGINRVIISGNVAGNTKNNRLANGDEVISFVIASDRRANGSMLTAWVKINVYLPSLVSVCHSRLAKGGYVIVEGELMNREGKFGKLTEVRARELVFVK